MIFTSFMKRGNTHCSRQDDEFKGLYIETINAYGTKLHLLHNRVRCQPFILILLTDRFSFVILLHSNSSFKWKIKIGHPFEAWSISPNNEGSLNDARRSPSLSICRYL